jgi:hypothetical protein
MRLVPFPYLPVSRASSSYFLSSTYLAMMMPLESIDPTSATSSLASVMLAYATAAADPKLELELMNDASNVALGVSSLLNPSTVWLRLCNVLGRILIISADIQKGITAPDEWVFQLTMLGILMRLLLGSAMPLVFAVFSISSLSVRDRRTFSLLFESVGLTVLQYKTLLASTTLDWIQYEADTSVELDGSFMYFLYSGEATTQLAVTSNKEDTFDTSVESIRSDAKLLGASNRIFGDVQFAAALESLVYKKTTKSCKSDKKAQSQVVVPDGNSTAVAESRIVVGSQGASMLRISTDKIIKLMKNDNELTSSIQRLVSVSMQEKLRSSSRFLRTS